MLFHAQPLFAGFAVAVTFVVGASAQPIGAASQHSAFANIQTTVPVSERVPNFNIEGLCKATAADDAAAGVDLAQPVENCVRDETAAKQQLATIWEQNAGPTRDGCEGEAAAGPRDSQSYVDLLTCMQMAGFANPGVQATTLRGGSKTRNKK